MESLVVDRRDQIIDESIRCRRPVTITHRCPDGWRTFKARISSGHRGDGVLSATIDDRQENLALVVLKPGETVGVSFRLGHRKCMFSSSVRDSSLQGETLLVRMKWPEQLQQLQRRVFERAAAPRASVIAVRFWLEQEGGDSTAERVVRHGQLEDISAGGMRIRVADATDVMMGAAYRCVFAPRQGAPPFVLDATLRHREAADQGRAALGFQFLGLETSVEGRRTLERLAVLVSQFHRGSGRRRPRSGGSEPE